jgi:hypothetical protein
MIRIFCKLVLGLTLTGCTVNNIHNDSYSVAYKISHRETTVVEVKEQPAVAQTPVEVVPSVITGNTRIRPECGVYVPLPIPQPVRIDFKKLEQAETTKEINGVILDNVRDLNKQMIDYGLRQRKHHEEYVRRCVVK